MDDRFLYEKRATINGLNINYKIIGQARPESVPFLILHGWGSRSEKWQDAIKIISDQNFRVIILDLPGFGLSDKPKMSWNIDEYCNFIEDFIKFVNLDSFYLVGHSFGGALAIKYCLRHSQKIKKLFLIDAACFRRSDYRKKFFYVVAKIFKIFSFLPFYDSFRKVFYDFIVGRSDYAYVDGVMKESFLKIINEDLGNVLNKIEVPTIIIWGEKDNITTIKEAYKINAEIKGSKLEIIPGTGHSPYRESPKILAEKILENINH